MDGKKRILVVEDNEQNRIMLRDILLYHGYEVIEANDGEVGLNMARQQMPALVLMDIQMPVMDGLTAGKALKSDPKTNAIKLIAVTSFAMKGDQEKIIDAGFDDYIAKPIDTRLLPEMIKKHLE